MRKKIIFLLAIIMLPRIAFGQAQPLYDKLQKLHDVTISSPQNNEVLTYETSSTKWKNKTVGSAESLKSPATTGLMTATGMGTGTTRAKTVRDANDTILELGGSYTPSGTWIWTTATVTWPTFNQNTTGTAANLSGTPILPSGTTLVAPVLGTPASGTLTNCTFPTLNQNTTGTAANVSGTPALPNGTTATTQSQTDASTKLATTAYADTGLGTKVKNDGTVNPTNLLSNGDFENWTAGTSSTPDGWTLTGTGASVAREASTIKIGTYSAKTVSGTTNQLILGVVSFEIAKGLTYWKNRAITFSCWVWTDTASRVKIGLGAGVNIYSSYHTGNSTWQLLTASGTIDNSTTSIGVRLQIDAGASSVTAYFDGAIIVEGESTFAFSPAPVNKDASWLPTVNKSISLGGASNQFAKVYTPAIAFPATQVTDADANTLDDYEEGAWTMGISFGGGTTGITYTRNTGYYTKIGNVVTVVGFLTLSAKGSSTGSAYLTGLPFTIVNDNAGYGALSLRFNNITFANQFQGEGEINTATVALSEITEAGAFTALTDADFANNSAIMINFTYRVA